MNNNDISPKTITNEIPTPVLGIIKGILMIAFGIAFAFEMLLGIGSNYIDYHNISTALIGWGWLLVILGLFLWRGIVAIVNRNKKRVIKSTVVIWAILIIGIMALLIWLFIQ